LSLAVLKKEEGTQNCTAQNSPGYTYHNYGIHLKVLVITKASKHYALC
jgi:hypothetical protein